MKQKQRQNKLINYKNEEYEKFVGELQNTYSDNVSAIEQYKKIYTVLKINEEQSKEDTYTFAKRYIFNNETKSQHINIDFSFYIGVISGMIAALLYELVPNGNIYGKFIGVAAVICVILLYLYNNGKKQIQKIRVKEAINNNDIILTVLQNYCEKIENEFDWMEESVENERIEETN